MSFLGTPSSKVNNDTPSTIGFNTPNNNLATTTNSNTGDLINNRALTTTNLKNDNNISNDNNNNVDINSFLSNEQPFLDSLKEIHSWATILNEFASEKNVLEKFENAFEDGMKILLDRPLYHPPRNNSHKEIVEKMDRTKVDVVNVLRLANELELDEKYALNLWNCAHIVANRKVSLKDIIGHDIEVDKNNLYNTSLVLFFWKRESILNILKCLIQLRSPNEENIEAELKVKVIRKLTDKVLEGGSLIKLMTCIQSHNEQITRLLSPESRGFLSCNLQIRALQCERRQLCEILFQFFHWTFAEGNEILELIRVISSMSRRWVSKEAEMDDISSYHAFYVLLMTLLCVLDRGEALYDRAQSCEIMKPIDLNEENWILQVDDELKPEKWNHEGVIGVCLLFWGAFTSELDPSKFFNNPLASKENINRKFNEGFGKRGLAFLRGIVHSPSFIIDDFRPLYLSILFEFTQKIIRIRCESESINGGINEENDIPIVNILSLRIHLINNQQQHHNSINNSRSQHHFGLTQPLYQEQMYQENQKNVPLEDTLEDFIEFLSSMFILDPLLVEKFWDRENNLALPFLNQICKATNGLNNDPYSLYVVFLKFLSSLGNTTRSAINLTNFLGRDLDRNDNNFEVSQSIHFFTLLGALKHFKGELERQPNINQGLHIQSQMYQQQQSMQNFHKYDEFVICCWLRVLNCCVGFPESRKDFLRYISKINNFDNIETSSYGFITLCLEFLRADLEPALKAQLTWVISKLVPEDKKNVVMNSLDSNEMQQQQQIQNAQNQQYGFSQQTYMQTQQSFVLKELVKADLNQKELLIHSYPFTNSYLDLIYATVCATPESESNLHNLIPTLEFVMDEIFLKIDQRKCHVEGEKWKLYSSCLKIFVHILDKYSENSESAEMDFDTQNQEYQQYSAGFWVMTKMLEGAQFFSRLIELIQSAGGSKSLKDARTKVQGIEDFEQTKNYGNHFSSTQQQHQYGGQLQYNGSWQQDQQNKKYEKHKWFVVASQVSNLDIRNSSAFINEKLSISSLNPSNIGHGMIRARGGGRSSQTSSEQNPFFDGGRFAKRLSQVSIYGWVKPLEVPEDSTFHKFYKSNENQNRYHNQQQQHYYQQQQQQQQYTNEENLDDGDIGGLWKENACKLALRFLEMCSAREDWFFQGIHEVDLPIENRLEHLHRLFIHKRDRIFAIADFFNYPFSVEMQLNAIKLIFRLSQQAPSGTLVQSLGDLGKTLIGNVSDCLISNNNSDGATSIILTEDGETIPNNMNANDFQAPEVNIELEKYASDNIQKKILELLDIGLLQPRGNISELLLGFANIANGTAPMESVNLKVGRRCALNVVLDALEEKEHPWRKEPMLTELMYRLVFRLCDNRFTGYAMSLGLNSQRDRFWLRHFTLIASTSSAFKGNNVNNNLVGNNNQVLQQQNLNLVNSGIAWVLRGLAVDLKVFMSGVLHNYTCRDIIPELFSVDSSRDFDRTHLRILELLDAVSLDTEQVQPAPESFKEIERYNHLMKGQPFWSHVHQQQGFYFLDKELIHNVFTAYAINNNKNNDKEKEKIWKEIDVWVEGWNEVQSSLESRAHIIAAWKDLVKLCLVDCHKDFLLSIKQNFKDDAYLLKQLAIFLLNKLHKSEIPMVLADPLADIVVILIAQIRFENDDDEISSNFNNNKQNNNDLAVAAATGNYSMGFCIKKLDILKRGFFCRISTEEFKKLLESILQALLDGKKSKNVRASLYSAFLLMVQGARSLYAQALCETYSQLPAWVTEIAFLTAVENMKIESQTIRDLKSFASITLDSLYKIEKFLIDVVVPDAIDNSITSLRLTGLSVLQILLQCDHTDGKWLFELRRRGTLRHLLTVVVDRLCADTLNSIESTLYNDSIYTMSQGVLCAVARTELGALGLVESRFLNRLSEKPLILLCDKRALDAWSLPSAVASSELSSIELKEQQKKQEESTLERRHDIVLPLLRLILSVLITMKNSFNNSKNDSNYHSSFNNKSSIDLSNNLLTFQEDCARFLRTNKRMLISAFRFQAESLQDMEESILLLSILTNCANKISMIMGDTTASDLDQIVFDLVQNLSSPHMQRGDWKNTISPYTYPEIQREGINVTPPPDMVSSQTQCSLFQLDIFSQQRRMLQQCIAYLRSRKKHFFSPALKENFQQNLDVQINSLILCIDHCSYSLAAVARSSSQKLFKEALSSKINTNTILKTGAAIPRINQEDSQNQISRNNNWGDITYIKWTCSSLLFILEGALIVLYNHFKTINKQKDSKDLVNKWLRSKILINYYDSSKNKSALEQLEEVIQSTDNVGTTLFVHLILRRMRELK